MASRFVPELWTDRQVPGPEQLFALARTDFGRAPEILTANGILAVSESDGMLWVGPKDGLGGYIGFHQAA